MNIVIIPCILVFMSRFFIGPLSPYPVLTVLLPAGLLVGGFVVLNWRRERRFRPSSRKLGPYLESLVTGQMLLGAHIYLLLVFMVAAPGQFGSALWATMGLAALLMGCISWGAALFLARLFGLAKPANERLRQAVVDVAESLGVEPVESFVIAGPAANAFAFPNLQKVGVTREAMALFDDPELRAILAHELGHLGDRKRFALASFGTMLGLLPMVMLKACHHQFGWLGVGVLIWIVLFALSLLQKTRRRMEQHADETASHAGEEDGVYASALEKLYLANVMPAVMRGKRQAHPHLYDRLIGAGIEPSYPRPAPPDSKRQWLSTLLAVAITSIGLGLFSNAIIRTASDNPHDENRVRAAVIVSGGGAASPLATLGSMYSTRGDHETGLALLVLALDQCEDYDSARALGLALVDSLIFAGECELASRFFYDNGFLSDLHEDPRFDGLLFELATCTTPTTKLPVDLEVTDP